MLPTKFQFIWESGLGEDFFRNQPIKNKNGLWWPCLLMDRDKKNVIKFGKIPSCIVMNYGCLYQVCNLLAISWQE